MASRPLHSSTQYPIPNAWIVVAVVLWFLPLGQILTSPCWASSWYKELSPEWGGHVRGRSTMSWADSESVYGLLDRDPYCDGSGELRVKNKVFPGQWGYLETHYEAVVSGGDTWRAQKLWEERYPGLLMLSGGPPDDTLRLMGLTGIIDETDDYVLYHRLDRLSLTLQPEWGTVGVGRQVLTWGNGLLFNPMDLFNPFAPTDIERDYKVGDDMLTGQFSRNRLGEFQFVYVPRRDPASHDVTWDQSSLAGKWHPAAGTTEFDVMCAKHYEDYVVGVGSAGYLGDAAWRMDATYTFMDEKSSESGFVSLVANIDYSWVWWGRNLYGFVEFYFNDLGDDDYAEALADPDIVERLARGEMFTLGRAYLAGTIQVELHPLFSVHVTLINNLADPSGILQPRAIWDITQDWQMILGGSINYGATGTEYGGFEVPGTNLLTGPRNGVFVWLSYFF